MTPRHERLSGLPRLSVAARPRLTVGDGRVVVEVDADDGDRWRVTFTTYQATRVWTIDLWLPPENVEWHALSLAEVHESPWLEDLSSQLAAMQPDATFMQTARHFIIHAPDDVVEVVAHEVAVERA